MLTPTNTVLMKANREWESRPADQRFGSLQAMFDKAKGYRDTAAVANIHVKDLRVERSGEQLLLTGPAGNPAALNNLSFTQLSARAGAPAGYLKTLPAHLVVENLNTSLGQRAQRASEDEKDDRLQLLFGRNGSLNLRAITGEDYSRIWNADVVARLQGLEAAGPWQPAPEAFDGSRGLYLGERDMFAFMVDNERRIFESLPGGGLSRGFFCWNSETGDKSIGVMTFFYEYVCGNHRVWGASGIKEMRVAHIHTDENKAWNKLHVELKKYAEGSASEEEAKIERARNYVLGATKDDVLDAIFGKVNGLTKGMIGQAYDKAEQRTDWYGAPNTAWGFAGGLTEIARDYPNADERVALDRAATKVMEIAF